MKKEINILIKLEEEEMNEQTKKLLNKLINEAGLINDLYNNYLDLEKGMPDWLYERYTILKYILKSLTEEGEE